MPRSGRYGQTGVSGEGRLRGIGICLNQDVTNWRAAAALQRTRATAACADRL